MPQTRAQRGAVRPGRPKRRAAAGRAAPQSNTGTVWTARAGNDLVGEMIKVYWAPDDIYYHAIVLEFDITENKHKIIYLNDESIEIVELGNGSEQRTYILASESVQDPLVGKELILGKEDHEEVGWFEFMRGGEEGTDAFNVGEVGGSLLVRVLSASSEEPEEDELAHEPLEDDSVEHTYCRVIYVANEFLATIDLAKVKYTLLEDGDNPDAEQTVLPRSSQRLGASVAAVKDVEMTEENDDDGDDYEPNAEQDESSSPKDDDPASSAQDDDVFPPDLAQAVKKLSSTRKGKLKTRRMAAGHKQVVVDDDAGSAFQDEDDGPDTKVNVEKDMAVRALEEDFADEPGNKDEDGNSVASNDTHDQPVAANGKPRSTKSQRRKYPSVFSDEESGKDGPDEDVDGSESGPGVTFDDDPTTSKPENKRPTSSRKVQVGDYIALETETGDRRKAFVEAYMPGLGMHFLAFCDTQGGNEQVKLTSENHIVLEDEEVDELNQEQKGSSNVDRREKARSRTGRLRRASAAPKPQATASPPAQTKTVKRRRVSTAEKSKGKKKKEVPRVRPAIGDRAGSEICGRCLKIVWPGSTMIYTALVLGYNPEKSQHQVVYLSDHCVEVMELKYRKWSLLSKEDEPWLYHGWLGKRLFVWWLGEYADPEDEKKSKQKFNGEVRVPFEAYVLSYEGNGEYMIIYTTTADKEKKVLINDDSNRPGAANQAWGVLGADQTHVQGLPVVGWEPWKDADWDSKKEAAQENVQEKAEEGITEEDTKKEGEAVKEEVG